MRRPVLDWKYISIHVLREEDDAGLFKARQGFHISIHVLREEDDYEALCKMGAFLNISIHVLREEDDMVNIR